MTLERFFSVDKHFFIFGHESLKDSPNEKRKKKKNKRSRFVCVCVIVCCVCLTCLCVCTVYVPCVWHSTTPIYYYHYYSLKKPFPPLQYSGLCLDSVAWRRRSRNFGRDLSVARDDPSLRVYSHMVPISRSDNQYIHI